MGLLWQPNALLDLDMLLLRRTMVRIDVQAQTTFRIVKQGFPDSQPQMTVLHAVTPFDRRALRWRQVSMGDNLQ